MTDFSTVSDEDIRSGLATDEYFLNTEAAFTYAKTNPEVVAEVTADQFPTGEFEVFAGLQDAVSLLEPIPVEVDAIPEGTRFDGGPVMRIKGKYKHFARFETSLLGFLSHASGVATAARECVMAARTHDNSPSILSFGSRHVHPALGTMIERSALIGGVDGFSNVAAGEALGKKASGTMPHALMLSFGKGEQESAWDAYHNAVDEDTPCIILCDTFTDEVDEVERAVELLGDDLDGVRLDTTGSRRGDFEHIIKEVQYTLDSLDASDVDIYISGGLGPEEIRELGGLVSGVGVGSYIASANPVDFSLDIVERYGEDISKRGKLAGVKAVTHRPNPNDRHTMQQVIQPAEKKGNQDDKLQPVMTDDGVRHNFSIEEAAKRCLNCDLADSIVVS